MAVLSFLAFAGIFALSAWAIWSTIAPQTGRIIDLLAFGPVTLPMLPVPVPARSNLRNVTVHRLAGPAPLRVAA